MDIRVGQSLKLRGAEWVCTQIEKREVEEFAGCSSSEYATLYVSEVNCQDLDRQIDDFDKDDIVRMTRHQIILEQPGPDYAYARFTIRTKFHVKKVGAIPPEREEQTDGVLPDNPSESSGDLRHPEQVADVCGPVGNPPGEGNEPRAESSE